MKTLVDNIYYYQDELGSTSHIADASGALVESYQYDVYGKPRVYDASDNFQAGATPVAQFLQGGARWMPELGLYDDRNRFMSPDLGRFIQPDPIGFKGDSSNLYRYVGNDWANKTDPTGLGNDVDPAKPAAMPTFQERLSAWERDMQVSVDAHSVENHDYARNEAHQAAFSAEVLRAIENGPRFVQNGQGDPRQAPKLDQFRINRAVDLYKTAESKSDDTQKWSFTQLKDGRVVPGVSNYRASRQWLEQTDPNIRGVPTENGHVHPEGKMWAPFSRPDKAMGVSAYVVKNHDKSDTRRAGAMDLYHNGWEYRLNKNNEVINAFPNSYY